MTNKEMLIYSLILEYQPICDLCTSKFAGYSRNQDANSTCRELKNEGVLSRQKGLCTHCERQNIILNSIKKSK